MYILNRGGGASVGDVARYMNVSKPTARKRLEKLRADGWLNIHSRHWRGDAFIHTYVPTVDTQIMYDRGEFKEAYTNHVKELALQTQTLVQRTLI